VFERVYNRIDIVYKYFLLMKNIVLVFVDIDYKDMFEILNEFHNEHKNVFDKLNIDEMIVH
jgi:hypothetical protein